MQTPENHILGLIDRMTAAEREIEELEAKLTAAGARYRAIRETELPNALQALGTTVFKVHGGPTVEIGREVFASIAKDREDTAADWFEANGHAGLLKRLVTVEFDREQYDEAKTLVAGLREKFPAVGQRRTVNPMTLKSWVKKRLEAGEAVPAAVSYEIKRVAKLKE